MGLWAIDRVEETLVRSWAFVAGGDLVNLCLVTQTSAAPKLVKGRKSKLDGSKDQHVRTSGGLRKVSAGCASEYQK